MALTAKKVYAILKRQISDMEAKLNSPVRYRGTVATADLLPLNPDIGDMYNIESKSVYGEAGMNVAWNGVVWDTMGAPIDMSLYLTKEEAETVIQRLVTEYFEKNPVKPGATTEQAQQIEQNKTDIASLKTETGSLKEDISTKITKFYASSQGETHLADSDNGKIMDMMVYGKSEQKQYSGKNLLNATLQTTTMNGVTCTANGDGTYTLNGTATANTAFILSGDILSLFGTNKKLKMIGTPKGGASNSYRIQMWRQLDVPDELYDYGDGVEILAPTGNHNIAIWITNKFVCNNLIFKPMIVDASLYPDATYDDFEPYTGGIPSPSPDYPQEIKNVVNPTVKVSNEDGTKSQTVTLPYTLNAIPVSSGGNVTIDGQQYIADYVDVERGKRVQRIIKYKITGDENIYEHASGWIYCDTDLKLVSQICATNIAKTITDQYILSGNYIRSGATGFYFTHNDIFTDVNAFKNYVKNNDVYVYTALSTPEEIDFTDEEIAAFKALATYYPTTNISINSEQLDGYTVFNYPISMQNGWNYVKQQIGDTREYIYDTDARTQDTDLQAAEAYVNSEYAVALTELEV